MPGREGRRSLGDLRQGSVREGMEEEGAASVLKEVMQRKSWSERKGMPNAK